MTKQEALPTRAAKLNQLQALRLGFYAFCNDLQP